MGGKSDVKQSISSQIHGTLNKAVSQIAFKD